jgi:excisionase family DNA binding protein
MEENILLSSFKVSEIAELMEKAVKKAILESAPLLIEKKSDSESLLTIMEACKLLKLAKPTVYYLVQQSRIPFMRQGKKLYFLKDELIDWVRSGRKIEPPRPPVLKRPKKSNA